ncbi:MAG: GNAT family N-acetyltransferase [Sphingomonas sp.]|uniref:GNAT family N-acetyltransferase n=1 Tax=Sphingomonas sp. TaxID=28214 RepID=UPI001B0E785B|nr:GNAT family N-acetyltransferase [Sphingomonas sp.]MBO9621575.1 GNAT family N-acetyltransferase [Sphingomonas sp.]
MSRNISIALTDAQIAACFPVMRELRPHLEADTFVDHVRRLGSMSGFRLAYLEDGGVLCVAGLRAGEWLVEGRYLEIEDFVARADARSKGYGGELFDWIVDLAKAQGCAHLRLVSNTAREAAHRFYKRKGMTLSAYYFSMAL